MSNSTSRPVLVLNSGWQPINIVSVKKAIKHVWNGNALFIHPETYQTMDWDEWSELDPGNNFFIQGVDQKYKIPEIVVATKFDKLPTSLVTFSRTNLFKRDKWTCQYCISPDHMALTSDFKWKPIGDLTIGDKIVGFDENRSIKGSTRKIKESVVLSHVFENQDRYKVTLDDGKFFLVTREHLWLARISDKHPYQWYKTTDLLGKIVNQYFSVSEPLLDYESGWLSGMYDGEGWIRSRRDGIGIAQNPGASLDRIKKILSENNFSISESIVNTSSDCKRITINGGLYENIRLLSIFRPERLIEAYNINNMGSLKDGYVRKIVSVEKFDYGEIVKMQTSTGTFISDGYAHHNCGCKPRREDITVDHVIPRAQLGTSTWENCVLACKDCNAAKADRTPKQAGMKLMSKPKRPRWQPMYSRHSGKIESWSKFVK